jgi:YfiH family protein
MPTTMPDSKIGWITPDWPASVSVRAGTTTRLGGVSTEPYDSFNLGTHVGDDPNAVAENRRRLREQRTLPAEPVWLRQVHGVAVVDAAQVLAAAEADAAFTNQPGVVCAVMTADCLPVLLCDQDGTVVAAAHAGWRGLVEGVIEAVVAQMEVAGGKLMAWLGPAIGPSAFEVGDEVREQFLARDPGADVAFSPSAGGRWLVDIYHLARRRLASLGIEQVYGGQYCTFSDRERFYSYRRDGITGRMASLIWLQP